MKLYLSAHSLVRRGFVRFRRPNRHHPRLDSGRILYVAGRINLPLGNISGWRRPVYLHNLRCAGFWVGSYGIRSTAIQIRHCQMGIGVQIGFTSKKWRGADPAPLSRKAMRALSKVEPSWAATTHPSCTNHKRMAPHS
jgi:hypothetical protein